MSTPEPIASTARPTGRATNSKEMIAMSRKLYAAFVPLLAVVAFAIAPAAAQAAPHWYSCHEVAAGTGKYTDPDCTKLAKGNFELTRLPFTSAKTQVITWGKLTLHNATLGEVTCKKIDAGNVWNTVLANPGLDNIEAFTLYECTSTTCEGTTTVTAAGLPWLTELVAGPPIRDKTTGISVTIKCTKPVVEATFTGELTPEFVNDSPSYTEFGAGSGHLTSSVFGEGTVTGKDKIMGFENQEQIQVFNP
jgi:hypothetical protein